MVKGYSVRKGRLFLPYCQTLLVCMFIESPIDNPKAVLRNKQRVHQRLVELLEYLYVALFKTARMILLTFFISAGLQLVHENLYETCIKLCKR